MQYSAFHHSRVRLIVCAALFLMPFIYGCGSGGSTAAMKDSVTTLSADTTNAAGKNAMTMDTANNKTDSSKGRKKPPPTNH
jgi:uncharacterized alpha/beta hydrolase family protein